MQVAHQVGTRIRMPKRFPANWQDKNEEAELFQATQAEAPILASSQERWTRAVEAEDTDHMMEIWGSCIEQYFSFRSWGTYETPASYQGRGRAMKFETKSNVAPHTGDMDGAVDSACHRLGKLARRLEELCRKIAKRQWLAPISAGTWQLWQNICKDGLALLPRWDIFWRQGDIPDLLHLRDICKHLKHMLSEHLEMAVQGRREAWRARVKSDWSSGARRAYSFVRGDKKPAAPVLVDEQNCIVGDLRTMDR